MLKRIILAVCLLTTITTFAQTDWCGTMGHYNDKAAEHPEYAVQHQKLEQKIATFNPQNKSNDVRIIPTVVHVIHNFGSENISDQEIQDAIDMLNEDFRRLNADTSNTRDVFKPSAADARIEFRLAKIAPNGDCTDGIVRVKSEQTYEAGDNVKSLSYWPSDRYFNIWTVSTIAGGGGGGTILGYAQFPGFGAWTTYGYVCRADALHSRTSTHEAGHCFNLYHTFQGGCGSNCTSSGDYVCDTPPTANSTQNCDLTQNLCSNDANGGDSTNMNPYPVDVVDQVENYMSYDNCQNMFTKGQKDRMDAVFSTIPHLVNLTSAQNLLATGVDSSVACQTVPVTDFYAPYEYQCTAFSYTMQNNTYNAPSATFDWTFEGDNVSVSSLTERAPEVQWNETGRYDISLTATSAGGSDSKTKAEEAKVVNGTPIEPFTESFASSTFPVNDASAPTQTWFIDGVTNPNTWVRSTAAGSEGGASMYLDIKQTSGLHRLISPMIDLTQATCSTLTFDVAYAPRTSVANETFNVRLSRTCARTWPSSNEVFSESGEDLAPYTPQISGDFVPTAEDWKTHTIDISSYMDESEVLFMFEFEASNGNGIYLDNIVFGCSERTLAGGIEDQHPISFHVFPNPSPGYATLRISSESGAGDVQLNVLNATGQMVAGHNMTVNGTAQVQLSDIAGRLPIGMYMIQAQLNGTTVTKKLIIQ